MTTEDAIQMLSARVDGELTPEQEQTLEAWLRENPDGKIVAEAFRLQDAEIRTAFEPRREAASMTAERVVAQLPDAVQPVMPATPSTPAAATWRGRRTWAVLTPIAVIAILFLALFFWPRPETPRDDQLVKDSTTVAAANPLPDMLTPKPKPSSEKTAVAPAKVGEIFSTKPGERRRYALPDGSILYVNQNTSATLTEDRKVKLDKGQVFVEAVPQDAQKRLGAFTVQTPERIVTAKGTKFAVDAADKTVSVLVAQGSVAVDGEEQPVFTGQTFTATEGKAPELTQAHRASHDLDWTKDLMIEADSPLVPGGHYDGGALVAVDPYGQESKLSMMNYHIDVHIEEGFARTTIDQTYFNHENMQLEGTFYFPLPPDASLSRLAMYVSHGETCTLMEGGMAERDHARQTYERIRHARRDPALLEWVDGSLFKMRVFPLEARQEKRLILSYSQKLPVLYGRTSYRFPAGHTMSHVKNWSISGVVKGGAGLSVNSPSHPSMQFTRKDGDLFLSDKAEHIKPDRDVTVEMEDNNKQDGENLRWSRAEHEGATYLMMRWKPELQGSQRRERRDWVFLFEASGARDQLVARTQVEVIRALLNNAEHDDTFSLLTVGTHVRKFSDQPRLVTAENVQQAIDFLDKTHLIGALNLEQALKEAQPYLASGQNPHLVHVGGGVATLGEQRADKLIPLVPQGTRFVGVAVGKRFSPAYLKVAAEKTGGFFTQINPDEPVAWRGFDLASTLNTPRLLNITLDTHSKAGSAPCRFLTFTNAISQGEELAAVARVEGELPSSVAVRGSLDGVSFEKTLPVKEIAAGADYLPRTWAKLEIDRLLAEESHKNRERIIELSKGMYVMTPYTSLLVLENDAMYKEFNVDRGRKDHWAMYRCPDKIPVVYIPDPNQPRPWNAPEFVTRKPHVNAVRQTILNRSLPRYLGGQRQDQDQRLGRGEHFFLGTGLGTTTTFGTVPGSDSVWIMDGSVQRLGLATDFAQDLREKAQRDSFGRGHPEPLGDDKTPFANGVMLGGRRFVVPDDSLSLHLPEPHYMLQVNGGQPPMNGEVALRQLRELADVEGLRRDDPDPDVNRPTLGYRFAEIREANEMTGDLEPLPVDGTRLVGRLMSPNGKPVAHSPFGDLYNSISNEELENLAVTGTTPALAQHKPRMPLMPAMIPAPAFGFQPGNSKLYESMSESDLRAASTANGRAEFVLGDDLGSFAAGRINAVIENRTSGPRYYQRPSLSGDQRVFSDLAAYAPGMTSSAADIQAVLETEAAPRAGLRKGKVDAAARERIELARTAEWHGIACKDATGRSFIFNHDGQGRYSYERRLPLGLLERVVCDGSTLLHLYPELGIGARRKVSRFHRQELSAFLPHVLPPADDLAYGADVKLIDANTVAIVPLPPIEEGVKVTAWLEVHLEFNGNQFVKRSWVLKQAKSDKSDLLCRQVFEQANIKLLDASEKTRLKLDRKSTPQSAPDLKPDLKSLVILPLPLRSRDVLNRKYGLVRYLLGGDRNWLDFLPADAALELLASEFAAYNAPQTAELWRRCFFKRGDRRIGFYTLLQSCGFDVGTTPELREMVRKAVATDTATPLMRYLSLAHSTDAVFWQRYTGTLPGPKPVDNFLDNLLNFKAILTRWQSATATDRYLGTRASERERAIAFARRHADNIWGWCTLIAICDKTQDDDFRKAIADAWGLVSEKSGAPYVARYEQASNLLYSGRPAEAREKYRKLFEEGFAKGYLPSMDYNFRRAFFEAADGSEWYQIMNTAAEKAIAAKRRPLVVLLAWQCRQLGDQPLADQLLGMALKDVAEKERVSTLSAAIGYFWSTGQSIEHADRLTSELLAIPALEKWPTVWRLASKIAARRGQTLRQFECLEKALDLEFASRPAVFSVEPIRRDYGELLDHYLWLAKASQSLKASPPTDLLARTVKAADRWRQLDSESSTDCDKAAKVLHAMGGSGEKSLAWEYLTTPLALRPNESQPWLSLASSASEEGDLALADACYAAAFGAEPTNAQILWDRAKLLELRGEIAKSRELMTQLLEGDWQPRFDGLKLQVRQVLGR